MEFKPIGILETPFQEAAGMPVQPLGAAGIRGRIRLDAAYRAGMKDLEGFSHLVLLYHFHRTIGFDLQVKPYLDSGPNSAPRGIFATRAPKRPNAIGLSVVRLVQILEDGAEIEEVDMLNGTPLLDIKPYVPAFDSRQTDRIGWFAGREQSAATIRADERFHK